MKKNGKSKMSWILNEIEVEIWSIKFSGRTAFTAIDKHGNLVRISPIVKNFLTISISDIPASRNLSHFEYLLFYPEMSHFSPATLHYRLNSVEDNYLSKDLQKPLVLTSIHSKIP